jgi:hypothetical protein
MTSIELEKGALCIDATIIGENLGVEPALVHARMRASVGQHGKKFKLTAIQRPSRNSYRSPTNWRNSVLSPSRECRNSPDVFLQREAASVGGLSHVQRQLAEASAFQSMTASIPNNRFPCGKRFSPPH